ncbi:MAG: hypothetical protein WAL25_09620 [Acidimicrobiia bacterium]
MDVILLVAILGFFALGAEYVVVCARMIDREQVRQTGERDDG